MLNLKGGAFVPPFSIKKQGHEISMTFEILLNPSFQKEVRNDAADFLMHEFSRIVLEFGP